MTSATGTDGQTGPMNLSDFWLSWLPRSAPQTLNQPILPDWSLIRITETNSTAPDTERRILEGDSYGRQIGRMMDVIAQLIAERPADAPKTKAIRKFDELEKRVKKAKEKAATDRLAGIRADLETLKDSNPAAYAREVRALRALLGE